MFRTSPTALCAWCAKLCDGERTLPPIHFVSGRQTLLGELADLAIKGGDGVRRVEAPARDYDVYRFVGDPRRAGALLDWRVTTTLETGFARLVADCRAVMREVQPLATPVRD
jgi:dTDP-glucose 4,6-dehydratase/UDP-glucose 4-epimerase